MKQIIDPAIKTVTDLTDVAKKVADDGIRLFHSTLGKLPFFSSIEVLETKDFADRDETHYFLVPYRLSECGYALYTQRVIPTAVGPENALPKARIFHLPADGTLDVLEKLITEQFIEKHKQSINFSAPLADRLDLIADEIDKQTNLVTGGLIVIGGVVAILNPLLGIGIAAKAILPTISSKLSKHGINHVSDWLRKRKTQKNEDKANTLANDEIRRLKPEMDIDATLALLEESISNQDPDDDPQLKFAEFLVTPEETTGTILAAKAISNVYHQVLSDSTSFAEANLHKADVQWLTSLSDFVNIDPI